MFPSSSVRSALLHAHPVHRPCRRGGETLFHGAEVSGWHPAPALVPGILWRQLRGQGLSGLSHQTEPEIPALSGQWIWLPEQYSWAEPRSDHAHKAAPRQGPRPAHRGGARGADRAFCLPYVPLPFIIVLALSGDGAGTPAGENHRRRSEETSRKWSVPDWSLLMEEWNGVKSKKREKKNLGLTWTILLRNVCWFFFYLIMDTLVIFGIFCWNAWARWKHITSV